ncbi:putative glycosyltransferase family 71 protein [Diaporthe ampelina]|uniref:Putative glycosyltransferase family 71 protein n=1 Tax=Diaporthe ampelina TaxID=1214573 RepID=A0A0G2FDC3_9PEZI|nr:putative glycosyltransferase family 71 protein [Diaporthe ampelina]
MPRGALCATGLIFLLGIIYLYQPLFGLRSDSFLNTSPSSHAPATIITSFEPKLTTDLVQYFEDFPLVPPFKERFGELGRPHLISSLRNVFNSTLPIQIVYAGDGDLSAPNRHFLAELVASSGQALDFLDILTVFDDSTLKLRDGGWAIKPFAVLGSSFEKVILLDSDAVFLQKPEVLLDHPGFQHTGALLFRDRLLWQHAFADRHQWWHGQIRRPSGELNTSLVWTQEYAEEGDSGVVVVDKSRTDVFMGLLHICWQNSYEVREEITYQITYGDKETWWMGFELAGSSYEMEKHYGAIVGWETEPEPEPELDNPEDDGELRHDPLTKKVCSFVIAHVDEQENLIWYNGGLLKNKKIPEMKHDYAVPEKWMVDGEWQKGATREDMSCMVGEKMHDLSEEQMRRLERSIEEAKRIDAALHVD